jgi:hypothetical protein
MGHRHFMYKVSKDLVNEVKSMTYEELAENFKSEDEEEVGCFYLGNLPKEEICEFGRIYWDNTAERIISNGVPLFEREEVMEKFLDYQPYIVGKAGLLEAIDIYQNKVISIYKNLLVDNKDGSAFEKQEKYLRCILNEWEQGFAINLNENQQRITSSWKYEYILFELTRLLKTIDFEKDTILFYGW